MTDLLTKTERALAGRAVRRRQVFLALSIAGIAAAAGLAVHTATCRLRDPSFPIGPRVVIVVLVLLNARQNLRQYRFAGILAKMGQDA